MNTNAEINYKMVILARESRGLTQKELADRLSISQSKLSKFEAGFQGLSDEILPELSSVLNYPESFFFQLDKVYNLSLYHYRRKLSIPKKELEKSEALINISRINLERLLNSIELPNLNIPNFTNNDFVSPVSSAQFLREYWKLPKGLIFNLVKLVEDNGILIIHTDFGDSEIDGLSITTEKNQPVVFLNKNRPSDRQRLTLAHEVAHLALHVGKHISPERDIETEAFLFASEFLMPEREIRGDLFKLNLTKLAQLKVRWRVSMGALISRAKSLETLSKDQYKYLWIQMGKLGYRTKEPKELDFPIEQPTLLKEIIDAHLNELGYTDEELAKLLAINVSEFRERYFESRFKIKPIFSN